MIKPGTIFCPYCCRTHTVPFYYRGDQDVGVELHYKNDKYYIVEKELVDPTEPKRGLRTPNPLRGIQLHSAAETAYTGLPAWVDVRLPGDAELVRMRRACPHCSRANDKNELGALPTLIVGMVGNRSSGKSALLNSTALPQHQAAVNEEGYPFLIDVFPYPHHQGRAGATPRMGRGMTKLVTIKHRKSDTPICHVLLLDVSGELIENRPLSVTGGQDSNASDPVSVIDYVSQDELTKILSGTDGYPGVDAVIFADPVPGSRRSTTELLDFNPAKVMTDCQTLCPNFGRVPMAYVLTHLDYYYVTKNFPTDSRGYPLMTKDTFLNSRYTPATLVDRIFTEDAIARHLPNFVPAGRSKQITKGFLVQSCSCKEEPKDGLVETYTNSKNIMDPLLWILNKLHVFPLTLD